MRYTDELNKVMLMLAESGAVFLGQSIVAGGTAMASTFKDVPREQMTEMPVAEAMQMGMCTGIALAGGLPVCIFPRINFMLLTVNEIVNHLDKLVEMSCGGYNPRVIIRTAIATDKPLHPGVQHLGEYTSAFRQMCRNIVVRELNLTESIMPEYRAALERNGSTILVERLEHYA